MQAAVPATWRELYAAFSTLANMRWEVCKGEGTSSSLRALKSDNQEYEVDTTATFLIRSGGHYWFSVLQARISNATLGGEVKIKDGTGRLDALSFLQSPQQVTMDKWEKIRAVNNGPCPRRNHSMTCLPNALCSRKLMKVDGGRGGVEEEEKLVNVRRIVFFGGQSEGIPFEAFGDLYLLCIEDVDAHFRWSKPSCNSKIPTGRSLHDAYRTMSTKILYKLSPSLSQLLGKSELTRPAAIKEFWAYVKDHELQDPKDGRLIHSNHEMREVFHKEEIGFTEVMGLVSKHLEKKPEAK
ncbi:SWIB/MDM2 domain containing hypothetical protein [Phytophthora palmivora]|uniref:DM2 domain-containing protein n=1 Tax=Phytophthora palmivora TaxID=4796 RepID=A0A2P4WZ33_9STRA|nr:SWIB/MDM2 domain containing hypothetical protein [Phytophthora palmivora]